MCISILVITMVLSYTIYLGRCYVCCGEALLRHLASKGMGVDVEQLSPKVKGLSGEHSLQLGLQD